MEVKLLLPLQITIKPRVYSLRSPMASGAGERGSESYDLKMLRRGVVFRDN